MKKSERQETLREGGTSTARSPYYALLAELRLRAVEATWTAQAKRAQRRDHRDGSQSHSA
ncbi:MAG TPA: hypothetical protein VM580_33840 [Labilithrix sp.]|nr:hypothetical protein [Labilithrix sp.]